MIDEVKHDLERGIAVMHAPRRQPADIDIQRYVPPVVARRCSCQPDLADDLAIQVQGVLGCPPFGQVERRKLSRADAAGARAALAHGASTSIKVAASYPPVCTTPSMNRVGVPSTRPDASPLATSLRTRSSTALPARSLSNRPTSSPSSLA